MGVEGYFALIYGRPPSCRHSLRSRSTTRLSQPPKAHFFCSSWSRRQEMGGKCCCAARMGDTAVMSASATAARIGRLITSASIKAWSAALVGGIAGAHHRHLPGA